MLDVLEVKKRFTYHAPKGDQAKRYEEIRNLIGHAAITIDGMCPDGREKSLAITKLEEAIFWFNAAIARNE